MPFLFIFPTSVYNWIPGTSWMHFMCRFCTRQMWSILTSSSRGTPIKSLPFGPLSSSSSRSICKSVASSPRVLLLSCIISLLNDLKIGTKFCKNSKFLKAVEKVFKLWSKIRQRQLGPGPENFIYRTHMSCSPVSNWLTCRKGPPFIHSRGLGLFHLGGRPTFKPYFIFLIEAFLWSIKAFSSQVIVTFLVDHDDI